MKSTCPKCNKEFETGFFKTNFVECEQCVREGKLELIELEKPNLISTDNLVPDCFESSFSSESYDSVNTYADAHAAMSALASSRKKQITIFTKTAGKDGQGTLMFNDVRNVKVSFSKAGKFEMLKFEYTSASTGKNRMASFNLENIAGWAEDGL